MGNRITTCYDADTAAAMANDSTTDIAAPAPAPAAMPMHGFEPGSTKAVTPGELPKVRREHTPIQFIESTSESVKSDIHFNKQDLSIIERYKEIPDTKKPNFTFPPMDLSVASRFLERCHPPIKANLDGVWICDPSHFGELSIQGDTGTYMENHGTLYNITMDGHVGTGDWKRDDLHGIASEGKFTFHCRANTFEGIWSSYDGQMGRWAGRRKGWEEENVHTEPTSPGKSASKDPSPKPANPEIVIEQQASASIGSVDLLGDHMRHKSSLSRIPFPSSSPRRKIEISKPSKTKATFDRKVGIYKQFSKEPPKLNTIKLISPEINSTHDLPSGLT